MALAAPEAEAVRTWIATDGERAGGVRRRRSRTRTRPGVERSRVAPPRASGCLRRSSAACPTASLSGRRLELDRLLEGARSDFQPDLVFCPSPVEIHPDHRALAEALFERVASSRAGDPDHDVLRLLRTWRSTRSLIPCSPTLSWTSARPGSARTRPWPRTSSQQAVRDYAGALAGLNAYRRLTLGGEGPVEAFRVLSQAEASTRSLEDFRRSIGPSHASGRRRAQSRAGRDRRPHPQPPVAPARGAGEPRRPDAAAGTGRRRQRRRRAASGSIVAGVPGGLRRRARRAARTERPLRRGQPGGRRPRESELVGFLDDDDRLYPDHLERLVAALPGRPEAVVYSDSATVVYRRERRALGGRRPRARVLARLRSGVSAARQLHSRSTRSSSPRRSTAAWEDSTRRWSTRRTGTS